MTRPIPKTIQQDPSTNHPTGLDQLVPYWVKVLARSIAEGRFADQVNAMLISTMQEAYHRGISDAKAVTQEAYHRGVSDGRAEDYD